MSAPFDCLMARYARRRSDDRAAACPCWVGLAHPAEMSAIAEQDEDTARYGQWSRECEQHYDATRPDLAPDVDETAAISTPPGSAQRRLPGLDRDLGVSQLLEDAVLTSVRERTEKEPVERPPDSHPHEYPPGGVE